MAILPLVFIFFCSQVHADSPEERALQLNEEMEYLLGEAPKARIWGLGSLPRVEDRSGPAPTQMEGIENLEDQFFKDEIRFKAAQAAQPTEDTERPESLDGSVPKRR